MNVVKVVKAVRVVVRVVVRDARQAMQAVRREAVRVLSVLWASRFTASPTTNTAIALAGMSASAPRISRTRVSRRRAVVEVVIQTVEVTVVVVEGGALVGHSEIDLAVLACGPCLAKEVRVLRTRWRRPGSDSPGVLQRVAHDRSRTALVRAMPWGSALC